MLSTSLKINCLAYIWSHLFLYVHISSSLYGTLWTEWARGQCNFDSEAKGGWEDRTDGRVDPFLKEVMESWQTSSSTKVDWHTNFVEYLESVNKMSCHSIFRFAGSCALISLYFPPLLLKVNRSNNIKSRFWTKDQGKHVNYKVGIHY